MQVAVCRLVLYIARTPHVEHRSPLAPELELIVLLSDALGSQFANSARSPKAVDKGFSWGHHT